MWSKYLLSLSICVMIVSTGKAQNKYCESDHWTDSAITHIQQSYNYTGDDWQLACDSLLAVCPKLDQVWQMKAMPNIKLGNWKNAFGPLEKATVINPDEWLSYQAFLKCIFSKDYEGALVDFEVCEQKVKGGGVMDHSFGFYRGLCYLGLGDLTNASAFLKKEVLDQEKSRGKANVHFAVLYYWGLCQLMQEDYLNAELTFRRSLEIYPQYPEPNFYIGRVYYRTGKDILARAYYVKARQYKKEGYNSSEDQEFYVNYPFAIGLSDIEDALKELN